MIIAIQLSPVAVPSVGMSSTEVIRPSYIGIVENVGGWTIRCGLTNNDREREEYYDARKIEIKFGDGVYTVCKLKISFVYDSPSIFCNAYATSLSVSLK